MSQLPTPPSPSPSPSPAGPLNVCASCGGALVHPLDQLPSHDGVWRLLLRCPDCDDVRAAAATDEQLDALEEHLDRCIADLASDLARIQAASMEDWVRRFSRALAGDHLLPEDF